MLNASRQSFPVSAAICILMAALFVVRYRLAPYPVEAPFAEGMPLAAALTRFSVEWPWWAAALAAVVVVWTLLVVVQISVKYAPASSRNYLPAQVFLVVAGGMAVAGEALASLLSAMLLALALRQFSRSFHKGYRFTELFHAGFWLGLIPLLYAPATLSVVGVALAGLAIYRRSIREAVVCLAGLLLPIPAAGFIHWAAGGGGATIYGELWRCTITSRPVVGELPYTTAAVAALVAVLALTAIVWVASHSKSIRKTQHKFITHISVTLLLVAASAAIPGSSTTLPGLIAVPCAVCVPYAFAGRRTALLSTVIYCLILVAVLAIHLPLILGISVP